MKKNNKRDIYNLVYNFDTNSVKGFTEIELEILLSKFINYKIDIEKFYNNFIGMTVVVINNQIIYYKHDVYNAILVSLGLY